MRDSLDPFVEQALPEMDPVISYTVTEHGWRGLTQQGEVLEVHGNNGHKIEVPSEIVVACCGKPIGRRVVRNDIVVDIDDYLLHFNRVIAFSNTNQPLKALAESDVTLSIAPTLRAKFNRAMSLLASGNWEVGLREYLDCENLEPFRRPQVKESIDLGLHPWQGEDLVGKRLLLLHTHGLGDTIQTLRYVDRLKQMGAEVVIDVLPSLRKLVKQSGGTLVSPDQPVPDFFCPLLHLLHWLHETPDSVDGTPYLKVGKPRIKLGRKRKRRIGVTWSVGSPSKGDYPRQIPLEEIIEAFPDAELHSVQQQNGDEARSLGVYAYDFEDMADCASLMMQLDAIVSVDTAALHLAGAIGHPHVFGLLSYWSSWRWLAKWYNTVKLCRQVKPDDWSGAFEAVHRG
jgi:hypothetical protein